MRRKRGPRVYAIQIHAFRYYAFVERRSVRESARLACIAKNTGLVLHREIRSQIAEERRTKGRS